MANQSACAYQPQMRLSLTQLPDADSLLDDASAGGSVTRLITFDTECDAPLGEGHGGCFPPETWQIDRLSHLDGEQVVQFALAPIADLADATLPHRLSCVIFAGIAIGNGTLTHSVFLIKMSPALMSTTDTMM